MAGALRTLSPRQLNRAVLARQLLLRRERQTLPRTLERIGGIQAQYAPSMYIGLWSRLQGFARHDLTCALDERAVVQGTLIRATIHLVSAADYWPFAIAVRQARKGWWLRSRRGQVDDHDMAGAALLLEERLRDGPLRREQIHALLGKSRSDGIGLWLDLVRVPPSGSWERRRANLFDTAERWIGKPDVRMEDGVDHLVRRYLRGFGPAASGDIVAFTGLPARVVAESLQRITVRRFQDTQGAVLYDLPGGLLPDPDTPAPVRFIPTWDATLLSHCRRAGILPEQHRPLVFGTKMPQSVPTFLVDGAVAGTWKYEDGHIRVEPFGHLDRAVSRDVDEEAERLAAMHG